MPALSIKEAIEGQPALSKVHHQNDDSFQQTVTGAINDHVLATSQ